MILQLIPIAINYQDKKIYHFVDKEEIFLHVNFTNARPLYDLQTLLCSYLNIDPNWVNIKLADIYKTPDNLEYALYGVLVPFDTPVINGGKWVQDETSSLVHAVRRELL